MRYLLFIIGLLPLLSITFTACGDNDDKDHGVQIGYSDLPEPAKSFFETYFSPESVTLIIDKGYVLFVKMGASNIDFYPDGEFRKIDMNGTAVPRALVQNISLPILEYIDANYPPLSDWRIEELERKEFGGKKYIEVEVVKGEIDIDILFDEFGGFVSVDR